MAKKKNGRKAGNGNDDQPDAVNVEQPSLSQSPDMEVTESPDDGDATGVATTDAPAETNQLRAELEEVKEQLAKLQDELASKDSELDSLRQQLEHRDAAPKFDSSKLADVQQLQDRLKQLRKEQTDADAARDAAWKQLKSAVQDISKLANPDYLRSINIPRAS
eukprot:jgi/Chrzof1/11039/Cz05g21110.t1